MAGNNNGNKGGVQPPSGEPLPPVRAVDPGASQPIGSGGKGADAFGPRPVPMGPDNKPLAPQPGVPQHHDHGQPNAAESANSAAQQQQQAADLRKMVKSDIERSDDDERFARHETAYQPPQRNYGDGRDDDLDRERGGDRAFSDDQGDRSSIRIDPERRRMLQRRFRDAVLPELPRRDGYRRCWVSTTHNYDTPQFRRGIGYRFVRYEDLSQEGWNADQYAVKDAQNVFSGCVMWREMIAMETNESNWHAIMRELHHDAPFDQARGIYESLEAAGDPVRYAGGSTFMSQGMKQLKEYTRPPRQFE